MFVYISFVQTFSRREKISNYQISALKKQSCRMVYANQTTTYELYLRIVNDHREKLPARQQSTKETHIRTHACPQLVGTTPKANKQIENFLKEKINDERIRKNFSSPSFFSSCFVYPVYTTG